MADSGFIGQGRVKGLSPDESPGDKVRELFDNHAKRFTESRKRILKCRDVRRGEHLIKLDPSWCSGESALTEWVQAVLPERSMIPLNLSNMLASEQPVYTRYPRKQSDQAIRQADESEVWLNGLRKQLVDWEEMVGKGVEDGEYAVVVLPSPAALEYAPDYMTTIEGKRTPNPRYDRDTRGRKPSENGYNGRSERASIGAWKEAYKDHLASTPPFVVRVIPATDCAPVLVRGRGRHRYECRGLVTRTLFEREELISRKFRWSEMHNTELIPRGFDATRATGQDGQLYLYEAYLISVDEETGEETPFIARSVGGYDTTLRSATGEEESATINLKEEYGVTRLMVHYAWGLHHADDDFDWRGVPILWPLLQTILNIEGLKTAAHAHAKDNAFTGHLASPDEKVPETAYLDAQGKFLSFKKPKADEIVLSPGPTAPWSQATVGEDVWRLIADSRQSLQLNIPDESQTGGQTDSSGHALVVSHELLESAKRQIKEGAREAVEFIGECFLELACGLARGMWKDGYAVHVPVYEDVERTADSGEPQTVREIIEFKEQWVGSNYSVTADFPDIGNLADRAQKLEAWKVHAATWDEMREAFGDQSPETTRLKVARDQIIESPIGQMTLQLEIAKESGRRQQAEILKQQLAAEYTKMGVPVDALAPELQKALQQSQQAAAPALGAGPPALGPGPGMPGSNVALPNMAQNSLNGAVSGEMGTAARQADTAAQMQVNPGGA